jgi:cytosine/uracil/thiamine/allantoin permease
MNGETAIAGQLYHSGLLCVKDLADQDSSDEGALVGRGRRYWFAAGFRPRALVSWAIGTLAAIPFIDSPMWTSSLSKDHLHGADLSGVVAFIVAGAVYLLIARLAAEPAPAAVAGEA